jgi:hypothetical protein
MANAAQIDRRQIIALSCDGESTDRYHHLGWIAAIAANPSRQPEHRDYRAGKALGHCGVASTAKHWGVEQRA